MRMALVVGAQGLRCRPLRTALAGVSLLLGTLAVICVQAASVVAERAVTAVAEVTDGRSPTFVLAIPGSRLGLAAARDVESSISARLDGAAVAVTAATDGSLGTGKEVVALGIVAFQGELRGIRPFPLRAGRWLGDGRLDNLGPRIVLNELAASRVDATGPQPALRIGDAPLRPRPVILGVVDDGLQEPRAYLSISEATFWHPRLAETSQVSMLVHESRPASNARSAIRSGLTARAVAIGEFERVDQASSLQSSVAAVQRIFVVIAGIALVVGMVSILNIGLATIGERIEELALRRAVGTSRVQLATIVLTEAMLVGLVSAGLAVVIGASLIEPITRALFPDLTFSGGIAFPSGAAVFGTAASVGAAVLGGLVPAARAARIPIAATMRA